MKLYATHSTKTEAWKVYDDNGRAYIVRTGPHPASWHSPDRSAADWVGIQRNASRWTIVQDDLAKFDPIANEPDNGDRFW